MASAFDGLTRLKGVAADGIERPIAVVDGVVHSVKDLREPITGEGAWVGGVNHKTFPHLCRFLRVEHLVFYEMRVPDLEPLLQLPDLRELKIEWNTKVTDIAPLAELRGLRVLELMDVPKVRDLSPVSELRDLVAFSFAGGIWNKNRAATLEPLAALPRLEELVLNSLKVESDGLRPLARCRALKRLELSNQFETADYAYLSVHLPDTECTMFAPWVDVGKSDLGDVMVVGKRKPFLNSETDGARIKKYERAFAKLQDKFRS